MRGTGWRLLKLITPFKGWIALSALLGFATVGSSIGLMATSAYIIARAALHPSIADLQVAIVGVRFFGIARGVFRYLERYVSHQTTFRLLARLRVWFYEALEPMAPARLMEHRSGDLLSRIVGDIESLQHFYIRVIAPPAVALLTLLTMTAFLYRYHPALAAMLAIAFLVAGIGVPLLIRILSRRPGQETVIVRAELHAALVDGIQGMADLLAFDRAQDHLESIRSTDERLAKAQRRLAWAEGLQSALGGLLAHVGMWGILLVAIPLIREGHINGVYLGALILAALASFEAITPLSQAAQHLESSLEAARRLFDIVDAHPAVSDPPSPAPPPREPDLVVEHLSFRYRPGDPPALDDISFALPRGKRLAIVGPSGAGKSTLVHLLLRFWDYRDGRILLDGRDLRAYRQEDVRRMIAVVSQHTHLFNATIRENLLIARPDADEEAIIQAARQAQIHEFIQSLPQGYETWIGEQGVRLSGGERQRLAITRALLKDAPILILDEATANLDVLTARRVLEAVHALMEGRTTLMITHRLADARTMDEILVLQAGRIVERGRHSDLLKARGLYYRMWEWQNQAAILEEGWT
ncbi:MAG: thiol reductant ABC exporter subunit CydC [Chloroflexi bacterium]|nr:thiol reductant ABC exporter subunit CydC [Chloroflexota bacterium]